jgi:hypothetical protein
MIKIWSKIVIIHINKKQGKGERRKTNKISEKTRKERISNISDQGWIVNQLSGHKCLINQLLFENTQFFK